MNLNKQNLIGKICLVTGATSGIGKFIATALADQGAVVIAAGRDEEKAEEVVWQIREQTGNESVHYLIADFSDLQAVRDLAREFKARFPRLDVLVNNAGAFFNARHRTQYGVEKTFLVNHLAPFLLTNLLLGRIRASAPARIVNVSSDSHKMGKIDFEDLNFERFYFGILAYARSKLANVLFTYELSRRLDGIGVTVNALHPGHAATNMWQMNMPVIGPMIQKVMGIFSHSAEEGADNSIYLASSPDVEGVTGKYFIQRNSALSSSLTYEVELAKELWEVSERLTKKKH